ncbi:MAG: hypothetical protein GY725_12350 [bacterium]|nr:hypothetical protein [bacterium]
MDAQDPWIWIPLIVLGAIPIVSFALYARLRNQPTINDFTRPECVEFAIRPDPGEWLMVPREQYGELFRFSSESSSPVSGWGDHRICMRDVEVAFAQETDEVQIFFEGRIESRDARKLAEEVRDRLSAATGTNLHLVAES